MVYHRIKDSLASNCKCEIKNTQKCTPSNPIPYGRNVQPLRHGTPSSPITQYSSSSTHHSYLPFPESLSSSQDAVAYHFLSCLMHHCCGYLVADYPMDRVA